MPTRTRVARTTPSWRPRRRRRTPRAATVTWSSTTWMGSQRTTSRRRASTARPAGIPARSTSRPTTGSRLASRSPVRRQVMRRRTGAVATQSSVATVDICPRKLLVLRPSQVPTISNLSHSIKVAVTIGMFEPTIVIDIGGSATTMQTTMTKRRCTKCG